MNMATATLLNGFILGWSVAWPPGPVNAEILRRSVMPRAQGGGFWNAWQLGLGACTADFLWALAVMTGAGAFLNTPRVQHILAIISCTLLLVLAGMFALGAWRRAHSHDSEIATQGDQKRSGRGYLIGFMMALTSPWNLAFWLAVVGGQQTLAPDPSFQQSLVFAASVVLGALTWTLVFSVAIRQGARIFARPVWQVATQLITSLLMLFFAARLLLTLR